MRRPLALLRALALAPVLALGGGQGLALTPAGEEFVALLKRLEPVHCQKRQLRREMALAQAERRDEDLRALQSRFASLDRDPATAKMERRLADLEKRISDGRGGVRDPQDLEAISFQNRSAFYRCE